MSRRVLFVLLTFAVSGAVSGLAQEGHPLTGTWTGDWGMGNGPRTHLTFVMSWDGDDKITGVINPGPDSMAMQNIVVNFANWTVRIDAEAKDPAGKAVRVQAEGKLENMGSPRRQLAGAWRQGGVTGDFKVTRAQ